jgi:hypothetical protein
MDKLNTAPDWVGAGKAHDWRNYISEEVRLLWNTFTLAQKQALMRQAEEIAGREVWD